MQAKKLILDIDTLKEKQILEFKTDVNFSNITFTLYVARDRSILADAKFTSDSKYIFRGRRVNNMINFFQDLDVPYLIMFMNLIDYEDLTIDNLKDKYQLIVWC